MSDIKPAKILIVEDNPLISIHEQLILEKNGFVITAVAVSSEEAVRSVREILPDIILMDIVLKGSIDGIDTAVIIQRNYDIPVIFLSDLDNPENLARIKMVHSHGYLSKPINDYEFILAVEMAIERHRLYRKNKMNEQKYRFIFESMQDIYFEISMDGTILEISPSVKNVFGWLRKEIIGHNIKEYLINQSDETKVLSLAKTEKNGKMYDIALIGKNGVTAVCDVNIATSYNAFGTPVKVVGSISDITSRKNNEDLLRNAHQEIEAILLSMKTILIGVSLKDKVTHWNREAEKTLKIKINDAIGNPITMIKINWEWERIYQGISQVMMNDCSIDLQEISYSPSENDEKTHFLNIKITPIKDYNENVKGFLLTGDDITENRAMRIRSNQSQKLESIGQLASGVAHEINTPTQYINDNTIFLKTAFSKLLPNLVIDPATDHKLKEELLFYIDEVPKAIDQTLEGIGKISKIVSSMKQFSHPGTQEKIPYNVSKIIDDVVTITRNEWKYVSDVDVLCNPDLPLLLCHPNAISQVLLNIIVNAAQSIEEKFGKEGTKQGRIRIETSNPEGFIEIKISDNGNGIPDSIREKVFDPFFTTKGVGKGTGQGLAIAYTVVTIMHGGILHVDSKVKEGSVFTIKIPLDVENKV